VGGGEELSFVEFEPGRADIPEAEAQKLDKLVKALYERPAVSLEIAGSFDPDQDRAALAGQKLEQQVKVLRLKELADAGQAVPSIETLQLEPAERERLLKQIYMQLGTNETLVLQPAALIPETNAAAPASPSTLSAGQGSQAPAASVSARTARKSPAMSEVKGAKALMTVTAKVPGVRTTSSRETQPPPTPEGAPLTLEQIEAKLRSAIQVSEDEQRDLVRQRAQSVRSYILKTGQVGPERLFIVAPKSAGPSAKGDHRVNLSLG
jgi:hypothetical protein